MRFRNFGHTGLTVSELGFGGWAIGGTSFGAVDRRDALRALAAAEELGCNFVDTAAVYGDSESILGEFLKGRREKWILASKYSGQPQGMTALVEEQLDRLGTDRIDFYQIHWAPHESGRALYEELERLRESGRVRFTGVSLYSGNDIEYVLEHTAIDGFQVAFSLLDPRPLIDWLPAVRASGRAVVVRSVLNGGFLTGRYSASARFDSKSDQRNGWSRLRVAQTAARAERFRFLEEATGSMLAGAVSYPLAFPEVCTVVISTKNERQALLNFSADISRDLSGGVLQRIRTTQASLGLLSDAPSARLRRAVAGLTAVLRR